MTRSRRMPFTALAAGIWDVAQPFPPGLVAFAAELTGSPEAAQEALEWTREAGSENRYVLWTVALCEGVAHPRVRVEAYGGLEELALQLLRAQVRSCNSAGARAEPPGEVLRMPWSHCPAALDAAFAAIAADDGRLFAAATADQPATTCAEYGLWDTTKAQPRGLDPWLATATLGDHSRLADARSRVYEAAQRYRYVLVCALVIDTQSPDAEIVRGRGGLLIIGLDAPVGCVAHMVAEHTRLCTACNVSPNQMLGCDVAPWSHHQDELKRELLAQAAESGTIAAVSSAVN